jgi:hypothetical protein
MRMKKQADSVKVVVFWNVTPCSLTFQFTKCHGFNTPIQRAQFLTGLQQESEKSKRVSEKITLMAHVSHHG